MVFVLKIVLLGRSASKKISLNNCLFTTKGIVSAFKFSLMTSTIETHACSLTAEIEVFSLRYTRLELADQNITMVMDENASASWLAFAVKCPMVNGVFIFY